MKKDVDDDDTDNISRKIRLEHVISFSDAIFAFSITFMAISIQSILVLDDEFDILTTIKSFLQKHGFHVYAFTDPHLALEHFQINATIYCLIISDIRMPQMNGFQFIKKVKEIKPEVKVFFMTTFEINDIEFRRVLPSMKIDEFIQKPILLEIECVSTESY